MDILQLKKIFSDKKIVICGAAPSLKKYRPIDEAVHIALNRAFLYEPVKFDAMICTDYTSIAGVSKEVKARESLIKIFGKLIGDIPSSNAIIPNEMFEMENVYQFLCENLSWDRQEVLEYYFADSLNSKMRYYQSVACVAFQIVALCKPKEIILVGLDFSQEGHFTSEGENEDFSQKHRQIAKETWQRDDVRKLWNELKKYIHKISPNTKVISYNPKALTGIFEDEFHVEECDRSVTAYIGVKENSVRLPGKNILPFGDSNLLVNKIRQLKLVDSISKIIVSTDSEVMLDMAEKEGVIPMPRPKEYANESRPYSEFVEWLADRLPGDHIIRCPVTAPLCRSNIIADSIKKYFCVLNQGFDSLTSVTRFQNHMIDDKGPMNFSTGIDHKGSQDLPVWYEIANCMDIEPKIIMQTYKFQYGPRVFKYEVDPVSAIDIDEKVDYDIACAVHEYWNKNNLWKDGE